MLQMCRAATRDCGIGCWLRENSSNREKESHHDESQTLKRAPAQDSSRPGQDFTFPGSDHSLVMMTLRLPACTGEGDSAQLDLDSASALERSTARSLFPIGELRPRKRIHAQNPLRLPGAWHA